MQIMKGHLMRPGQGQKHRRMLNQLSSHHNQQRRRMTHLSLRRSRQKQRKQQKPLHCPSLLRKRLQPQMLRRSRCNSVICTAQTVHRGAALTRTQQPAGSSGGSSSMGVSMAAHSQ
jgi:hypothetical protein